MQQKQNTINTGNNTTGASVGGFELADDHYLAAANTVGLSILHNG